MKETPRNLHRQAMAHADRAKVLLHSRKEAEAKEAYFKAYELEIKAAGMCGTEDEPTRSVLYRSAAWQAVNAGMKKEAIEAAQKGLQGNPSNRMELEEVLKEASK